MVGGRTTSSFTATLLVWRVAWAVFGMTEEEEVVGGEATSSYTASFPIWRVAWIVFGPIGMTEEEGEVGGEIISSYATTFLMLTALSVNLKNRSAHVATNEHSFPEKRFTVYSFTHHPPPVLAIQTCCLSGLALFDYYQG